MSADDRSGPMRHPVHARFHIVVLVIALCALVVGVMLYAPVFWRNTAAARAAVIEQEDREFCERFGMPVGSAAFPACAANLGELRQRHGDRLAAEAAGIL